MNDNYYVAHGRWNRFEDRKQDAINRRVSDDDGVCVSISEAEKIIAIDIHHFLGQHDHNV
jgi:hypothetical protein